LYMLTPIHARCRILVGPPLHNNLLQVNTEPPRSPCPQLQDLEDPDDRILPYWIDLKQDSRQACAEDEIGHEGQTGLSGTAVAPVRRAGRRRGIQSACARRCPVPPARLPRAVKPTARTGPARFFTPAWQQARDLSNSCALGKKEQGRLRPEEAPPPLPPPPGPARGAGAREPPGPARGAGAREPPGRLERKPAPSWEHRARWSGHAPAARGPPAPYIYIPHPHLHAFPREFSLPRGGFRGGGRMRARPAGLRV
jgi:hypothetical protein